jgi:hypothetical protein
MPTKTVTCCRQTSPSCLGSAVCQVDEPDGGGDPELAVVVILPREWTLLDFGDPEPSICCVWCLHPDEAAEEIDQRARVEKETGI